MFRTEAKRLLSGLLLSLMLWNTASAERQDILHVDGAKESVRYQTETVRPGTYEKIVNAQAEVYYPIRYEVFFEREEARFIEYTVSRGDEVKAGDVLMRFGVSADQIEIKRRELALSRAQEDMKEGVRSREEEIAQLRIDMSAQKDNYERQKASIRLRKLQTELERYKSSCLYDINRQTKELDKAKADLDVLELTAPADGIVGEIAYKKSGAVLKKGDLLVEIYSPEIVMLRVGNSDGKLRFGMPVTVIGGSGTQQTELSGWVASCDEATGVKAGTGYAYIVPEEYDTDVKLRNLKIKAAVVRLENVMLISKNSLKKENEKFYVEVLQDGKRCRRYVTVGMSGTSEVWLLDGVTEGDVLIVN